MRYALAVGGVLATVLAVWLLSGMAGRTNTFGSPQVAEPNATADAVRRAQEEELLLRTRPTPDPKMLKNREQLIGQALSIARSLGEENGQVIDVQLTTAKQAAELVEGDVPKAAEELMYNLGGSDRRIYLVRVRGNFRPSSPDAVPDNPADAGPRPGLLYTIHDGETGEQISYGLHRTLTPTSP